ncbi:MAG: AgmX/PglI C-terminal domain-containing protein [Myxococcaceae bacterium]|nr:AgmX/PglI C-terminal domain-containing protein [Myxococcaceae bacterium]MCI0670530.1 AgmX/PglI C-terminal domain-containing protein [Myxococcaceae bacterium]
MALSYQQNETFWVYRLGDLVLGPVASAAVEEMLFAGTLTGQSVVAPAGSGAFRPLSQVERFRLTVAKAEAKLRVEATARAEREAQRRRRMLQLAAVAGVALIAAGVAAFTARYLAVHASLGTDSDGAEISMEAPVIRLASAEEGLGEELLEYGQGTDRARTTGTRPGAPGPRVARRTTGSQPPGGRLAASGEDGLETGAFDQGAIQAVVASRQTSLYPCLKAAAQAHPDVGGRVPIEFVIGSDGRVSRVWVDRNELKQGELEGCLLKELQKWPFPAQAGEQPAVSLVFNLGRRS